MKARVKPSLLKKMDLLEEKAEDKVKKQLEEIAEFATSRSPVDTGAYVTSFSMKHSYSSGRGRTSHGKPRHQDPQAKRSEGLAQLISDIKSLEPIKHPLIVLSNGAPHAKDVEYKHGYAVFTQVKDRFR